MGQISVLNNYDEEDDFANFVKRNDNTNNVLELSTDRAFLWKQRGCDDVCQVARRNRAIRNILSSHFNCQTSLLQHCCNHAIENQLKRPLRKSSVFDVAVRRHRLSNEARQKKVPFIVSSCVDENNSKRPNSGTVCNQEKASTSGSDSALNKWSSPSFRSGNESLIGGTVLSTSPVCSELLRDFTLLIRDRVPVLSSCKDASFEVKCCTEGRDSILKSRKKYSLRKKGTLLNKCKRRNVRKRKRCSSAVIGSSAFVNADLVTSDEEGGFDHERNQLPDKNGYYQVERILAKRISYYEEDAKRMKLISYYIKWVGWTHAFDSWVPTKNLGSISLVMEKFETRERALSCVMKKPRNPGRKYRLRQLRNLDRWETEINATLKKAHMKNLYVYNGVNESLKPKGFKYIVKSIFPKEMEQYEVQSDGHRCCCGTEECGRIPGCCPALESYDFFYTVQGHLKMRYSKEQGKIIECNRHCSCSHKCPTKVVQRGRRHSVAIVQTEKCGWGVFALEDIPANRFVVEYVGEILSVEEAKLREDPHYQFEVSENSKVSYVIDARNFGNESAFINHSCQPNLVAIPVYVERMIPGYHRIAFFTTTDVKRGEELTLDYFDNPTEEENYIRDTEGIKCHCGADCCTGYFPQIISEDGSPQKVGITRTGSDCTKDLPDKLRSKKSLKESRSGFSKILSRLSNWSPT